MADTHPEGEEDHHDLLFSNEVESHPLRQDHCDLLMDAIDAQLGQLQFQPQRHQDIVMKPGCHDAARLQWSQSVSKDTGLGSTTRTNDTPMSCLDLMHTPTREQESEMSAGSCREDADAQEEDKKKLSRRNKEEMESRREEVMWRLGKLLGDSTCDECPPAGDTPALSDSVCTEDFVRRFSEEMVEVAQPQHEIQQQDREEEETERTDDASHRTQAVTQQVNKQHNRSCSPQARFLAGVPVRSFDSVSIASDLDSISTERVRQHINTWPGWRSLLQSVTAMDDDLTNHSDDESTTPEESEAQSIHRPLSGHGRNAQHKKTESHRSVCSLGNDNKDTDEESNLQRSERSRSDKRQWTKTKETLADLRQKCETEEKTLRLKRTQLEDVELSLCELQQRRKHALQELGRLTAETAQMEKQRKSVESALRDSRVERGCLSDEVENLQRQRDSCLGEIRELEEEVSALKDRCSEKRKLMVTSVLEREEMERQLNSAKTELFAEQRRAREKLESIRETLDQTGEELQRATEAERSLRSRCVCLEEKLEQRKKQTETLEAQLKELPLELGECQIRVGTLEKMLAQKELNLLDLQEQHGASRAEQDELKGALQRLQTQYCKAMKEAQETAHKMMVDQQAEEEKSNALKERTLVLTRCIESMQSSIQLKEEEVKKLRNCVEQQKLQAKSREETFQSESSEKVHTALAEERRKWEAEKVEAVQVHCGKLEEQNRKRAEQMKNELEREKSKTQTLQRKVSELKTKLQEQERESSAQQREQESLLAVICKSLREEHQAELQRSKDHIIQESQRAVQRVEQAAQLAQGEASRLRVTLEEQESSFNRITADLDLQQRRWGQELGAECQHVRLLVEQSGASQSAEELPASPSVSEALTHLRALREQLQLSITHLQRQLEAHKHTTQQLWKDKELELCVLRQQLRGERDQALDSLKERLIQEHIEELSNLSRSHASDGGDEGGGGGGGGGGVTASLRKQLKDKDVELRQVQKSMAQWKEQTAARLACKFEEEMTAELERCKTKLLRGRKMSATRGEGPSKPGRLERKNKEALSPVFSPPSLHVVDSATSYGLSDVASLKLLRYLQSRVKQLRQENQAYTSWNPPPPLDAASVGLSGSYLTTVKL